MKKKIVVCVLTNCGITKNSKCWICYGALVPFQAYDVPIVGSLCQSDATIIDALYLWHMWSQIDNYNGLPLPIWCNYNGYVQCFS